MVNTDSSALPTDVVSYRQVEGKIQIPNEIFTDLQEAIESPTHVAFAYSYVYLITYLYRYAKYSETRFTQPMLKSLLGFAHNYKKIDYIIKKGGVLDTIGYTQTTNDYPMDYNLIKENKMMYPEFTLISDLKKTNPELAMTYEDERNYKIKYPVKAFHRDDVSPEYDGTFFDARNTHSIRIATFLDALESRTEDELKTIGIYIYGYIKARIGQYGGDWTAISIEQLVKETRLSNGTVISYIKRLKKRGYLYVSRQNFFDNPNRLANEYQAKR